MIKVWQSQWLSTQISLKCSTDSRLDYWSLTYTHIWPSIFSLLSVLKPPFSLIAIPSLLRCPIPRILQATWTRAQESSGFAFPPSMPGFPSPFASLPYSFTLQSNVREIRDDLLIFSFLLAYPCPLRYMSCPLETIHFLLSSGEKPSLCHILEILTMCVLISIFISLYVLEPLSQFMKPQGIKN